MVGKEKKKNQANMVDKKCPVLVKKKLAYVQWWGLSLLENSNVDL